MIKSNFGRNYKMQLKKELEVYEKPVIEIVKFELKESIAESANFGPGTLCGEEVE